jgi:hypothetical protein
MRDPDRIPLILAAIEREWKKTPDLRLGQLLMNEIRKKAHVATEEEGRFLFDVEDNRLLSILGEKTDEDVQFVLDAPERARRELSQLIRDNPPPLGLSKEEMSEWIRENVRGDHR